MMKKERADKESAEKNSSEVTQTANGGEAPEVQHP
jgi:hypothetical protein